MWLHSLLKALKSRHAAAGVRRFPRRRTTSRLWVEPLEDRSLPSCTVALAPSDNSPLVGERVAWTATAADCGAAPVYQFLAAPHGGAFHVLRDFSPANAFTWTPMREGDYDIEVVVKDGYQGAETAAAVVTDAVASRVTGAQAVVTPATNPLVALYSVPPSSASTVFVQFAVAGDHPAWRNTDIRAVEPGKSTNFFVAGMLPNTTYEVRHVFSDGAGSAPVLFTTGSIPSTVTIPAFTVLQPPGADSDTALDMVFHQRVGNPATVPPLLATDLAGHVVWYADLSDSGFTFTKAGQSLLPGGTLLLNGIDQYTPVPTAPNVLREIDLAGDPVRETNLAAVNAQLAALGYEPVHAFHHDVQRLADGTTVALAYTEHTIDVNGAPTNYVGEMVLALDADFQVKWAWDAFDHLDVHRGPVLGEVTQPGSPEPTNAVPLLPAVDWLHVNAVAYSPADGDLIISSRHQDWVIKIDYRNGGGDGHVVWRLGAGGDFTLAGAGPDAWFSHSTTPTTSTTTP
jgi:arylsulfate sulfotransferase